MMLKFFKQIFIWCLVLCCLTGNVAYAEEVQDDEISSSVCEQMEIDLEQITPENPYLLSTTFVTEDGQTITSTLEIEDVSEQYAISLAATETGSENTTLEVGKTYTFRKSYTFDVTGSYSYEVVLRKNSNTSLTVVSHSRYAQPSAMTTIIDYPQLSVIQKYDWEVSVSGYVTTASDLIIVTRYVNYYVDMAACISTLNNTLAIQYSFSY